jgi:dipeptidyl aminopeptidase/acylaminoacyl peptidase
MAAPCSRRLAALLGLVLLACVLALAPQRAAVAASSGFTTDGSAAEAFARLPEYETALISPDGRSLAVSMLRDGFRAVAIVDAATLEPRHVVRFDPPNEAERFHWVRDDRLLVVLATRVGQLELPLLTGELYAVDADGRNGRVVFDGVVERGPVVLAAGDAARGELPVIEHGPRRRQKLLALGLPAGPGTGNAQHATEVLIATQVPGPTGARLTEAFRLDVDTGRLRRDVRAPVPDAALLADARGEVRFAASRDDALALHIHARTPPPAGGDGSWRSRLRQPWGEGDWLPVALDGPDHVLVLESIDADRVGAVRLDLATGTQALLYRDARVDIDAVLATAPGERPYALRYRPARSRYVQFAEPTPARRLFAAALAAFPDQDIELTSVTRDGRRAVARVRSDRDPGSLYLLSEDAAPTLLLRSRAWLPPSVLVPTEIIEARAGDGTPLQLFVNRPVPVPGVLPPIVVHPHGGPNGARDDWLFAELPQLLAARGYLVLRVNFRGSAGYGRAFGAAGDGEWDGAMLDDLRAGLEHVVAAGLGDGTRVAMLGESYGAYAALMSAARWPARFRCVIGSAGVYDLALLHARGDLRRSAQGRALLREMLGEDMAALRARSPLGRVADLRVPVLLVHGARDTRVPPVHAERMRDALAGAGNPAEYLRLDGEGHGYVAAASRQRYFSQVLAFLARHLSSTAGTSHPPRPVRAEPGPDAPPGRVDDGRAPHP